MSGSDVGELEYRRDLWRELMAAGGPIAVKSSLLRELRIYGGFSAIWVDKKRTGSLSSDGSGVTVSVLHTGQRFPDDLNATGVVYHYPNTGRAAGRDRAEIAATKAAHHLGLPIFVVTTAESSRSLRDVRIARVESWDDRAQIFTIAFDDTLT